MSTRRFLILVPLALSLLLVQSYFWVPTYDEQARGNPARLEEYINASIGDASILNPILSADSASSDIENLDFRGPHRPGREFAFPRPRGAVLGGHRGSVLLCQRRCAGARDARFRTGGCSPLPGAEAQRCRRAVRAGPQQPSEHSCDSADPPPHLHRHPPPAGGGGESRRRNPGGCFSARPDQARDAGGRPGPLHPSVRNFRK